MISIVEAAQGQTIVFSKDGKRRQAMRIAKIERASERTVYVYGTPARVRDGALLGADRSVLLPATSVVELI